MLDEYEVKETSIIHDLYSQHFFPKGQVPKKEKPKPEVTGQTIISQYLKSPKEGTKASTDFKYV